MCKYNNDPKDITYIDRLEEPVYFTIIDPGEIDTDSIRIYIDGQLVSIGGGHGGGTGGHGTGYVEFVRWTEAGNKTYRFIPTDVDDVTDDLGVDMEGYLEGLHTLKIEAWDKSDAVDPQGDWRMLEKTVLFYIDTTPPVVVTHAAQRDGVRYFSSVEGATASITIVDEGSGVDGQDLQNDIFVDVFQHLTENQTPLRTKDSGDIINFQRKTLIATTKPILEYTDEYSPDGVDNENWIGIHEGTSTMKHKAWRASYTIHSGQISDGDTFEVVFYGDDKDDANMEDYNNENAVYLYEDLTRAYLMVWDGGTADDLSITGAAAGLGLGAVNSPGGDGGDSDYDGDAGRGGDGGGEVSGRGRVVVVPATQVPDLFREGLLNMWAQDVWWNYYDNTFLEDCLENEDDDDDFFVRHLVADTRAPVATLNVPKALPQIPRRLP
jgi:hypothetical protein